MILCPPHHSACSESIWAIEPCPMSICPGPGMVWKLLPTKWISPRTPLRPSIWLMPMHTTAFGYMFCILSYSALGVGWGCPVSRSAMGEAVVDGQMRKQRSFQMTKQHCLGGELQGTCPVLVWACVKGSLKDIGACGDKPVGDAPRSGAPREQKKKCQGLSGCDC